MHQVALRSAFIVSEYSYICLGRSVVPVPKLPSQPYRESVLSEVNQPPNRIDQIERMSSSPMCNVIFKQNRLKILVHILQSLVPSRLQLHLSPSLPRAVRSPHTYPVHRLAFSIAAFRPHVCPLTPGSVIALCGTDCRYPRGPDVRSPRDAIMVSVLVLVFVLVFVLVPGAGLSRSPVPARACVCCS